MGVLYSLAMGVNKILGGNEMVEEELSISEWWERLKMYVVIKSYNNDDCLQILNSRYFGDKPAFETFIVVTCVEDFDKLFEIIDSFGASMRIPSAKLISELYELCKKVNPMLTYSNWYYRQGCF